jgi:hypothetical protein
MTDHPTTLHRLGDALEDAARADLAAEPSHTLLPGPRRQRISTRVALVAAALVVVIPGVALAATQLIGEKDVAESLPAGTLALAGTNPSCTAVIEGVEYLCTLEHAPAPEISDWKGTVEPTVDATKHVNGGCRSLTSDGREWRCYIGQAAVEQQIIGPDFLGEYAPSPGVG